MKVKTSFSNLSQTILLLLLFLVVAISPFKLEPFQNGINSPKQSQKKPCQTVFDSNARQDIKCPDHCIDCSDAMKCNICEMHYFLINGSCAICDPNCYYCEQKKQYCTTCDLKKYLDINTHTCKNCMTNCIVCNNDECFQCDEGYFYSATNKKCERCGQYCAKCKSVAECQSCFPGYYLNEQTKYCNTCDQMVEHCQVCIDESQIIYNNQSQNYHTQKNHRSLLASSLRMEKVTCYTCFPGYLLVNLSLCVSCVPNCRLCTSTTQCQQCLSDYVLNSSTKLCQLCSISYCTVCQSPKSCYLCKIGYYWNNITHIEFPACQKCRIGCQTCGANYCKSCERGYYLVNQTCLRCSWQCSACNNTSSNCIFCSPGYFLVLNSYKCMRCPNECLKCKNFTICDQCAAGFRLSSSGKCLSCNIKNCTYCIVDHANNSQEACLQCSLTYYLTTNKSCQSCDQGCLVCKEFQSCIECMNRYLINKDMKNCQRCPDNCLRCNIDSNDQKIKCSSCEISYFINDKLECQKCNISNCINCYGNICQKCQQGYYIDKQFHLTCSKCNQNCTQCSNAEICLVCKAGFYLNKDLKCVKCNQNCTYCNELGVCLVCGDGFWLNQKNDSCQQCEVSNCKYCGKDNNTCYKCISGYQLQNITQYSQQHSIDDFYADTEVITSICYSCGKQQLLGCSQCQSSTKCLSCIDGYQLNQNNLCSNSQTKLWPLILIACALSIILLVIIGNYLLLLIVVKVKQKLHGKTISSIIFKKSSPDPENYHRLEQLSNK